MRSSRDGDRRSDGVGFGTVATPLWYTSWYDPTVNARLRQLLDLLESSGQADTANVGTSVRVPVPLRDAASLAADMGLVGSTTEVALRGFRDVLEAAALRAVLDAHYEAYPNARPDLADVAVAAAALDGNPLAGRPELIRRAVGEIASVTPDPTPDDVLMFAAGLAAAA